MPTAPHSLRALQERIAGLKASIALIGAMRPGSLIEHYRRCGKPNCRCAQPGEPGHGPQWLLTRPVAGKTVSVAVPREAVDIVRGEIGEYHRFRAMMKDLVEINVLYCDALMRKPGTADEAVKKGASKRPSRGKSRSRSRR
jgi:hypothetical protein